MKDKEPAKKEESSEFVDALKKGLLLGVGILVIVIPPLRMYQARKAAPPQPPVASAPAPAAPGAPQPPVAQAPQESERPAPQPSIRLADFAGEEPSAQARQVANWAVYTRDNAKKAFVVIDKKEARVYVFGPDGKLKESAPALLGAARGDHSVPGIGDKPLSAVKPDEKTTPAGRFVALPGKNANGEDIIWVDYDAAVSMHRIRPLVAAERRLERLATLTVDDNRISFGCVNLPVSFYENVLSPTVHKYGAIIYVLPDVRSVQQVFGPVDVPGVQQVALEAGKRT